MSSSSGVFSSRGILPAGARLNDYYEIDAFIKAGGMGEVYRGHGIAMGDPVAIKLIRDDMEGDPLMLDLLKREAEALNRLDHPAIVRYLGFALEPTLKRHYLVMKFVEGVPLSDLIEKRGPLALEEVFALTRRLAAGLQAAHQGHVVHRDMSPDNVMVPASGLADARIIDFGIARSMRMGDSTLIAGGLAGKYKYMSPEQLGAFQGDIRPQSDIYSLGLVIAQCLRGAPIDMGGTDFEAVKRREQVPDLSTIDQRIRPLLEWMLQPDPRDRPKSMSDVAAWTLRVAPPPDESTLVASVGARRTRSAPAPSPSGESGRMEVVAAQKKDATSRGAPEGAARNRMAAAAGLAVLALATVGGAGYALWPRLRSASPPPIETSLETKEPRLAPVDPAQVARFVKDYDGGDCFLVIASEVSSGAAKIDGFGVGPGPFEKLDAAFKAANGFEAEIAAGQVTRAQCPAVLFARGLLNAEGALRLDVDKRLLRSGDALSGSIEAQAPFSHLALFQIDSEGGLHDASASLGAEGGRSVFSFQRKPGSRFRSGPVLLLAIATTEPLPGAPAGKSPLAEKLAALAEQISRQSRPAAAVLKYVEME